MGKVTKKDPYTELLYWSLLKCCQSARETAWLCVKEKKLDISALCTDMELPEKKVAHWLDCKKKLVMSKAPRDRDIMILLRYLGIEVSVTVTKGG
jgi:hypothetical protein